MTQYLLLSEEEVEVWKEDSLKYFIDMKEESNETKGALLRDRAKRLIAGIDLRFSNHFKQFAATILQEMVQFEANNIQTQIQKDALMQLVLMRLNDEEGVEVQPLIQMIETELTK